MTLFWLVSGALVLLGLAVIAPPLLRGAREGVLGHDAQNVDIARQRLRELEAERDNGDLDPADFEQARQELERGLAADLGSDGGAPVVQRGGKPALVALAVLVPAVTIGVYQYVGAPEHVDVVGPGQPRQVQNPHAGGAAQQHSLEEMVQQLAARLEREPNDLEGWFMLGRSYLSMQRYPEAVKALERLRELSGGHPTALVMLADAIAMTQGGSMTGRPTELVLATLEKEPANTTALWLAGKAAEEQGEFGAAVDYWRQALPGLADQPQLLAELRSQIASAEQRGGLQPASAGAAAPVAQAPAAQAAPAAGVPATGAPAGPAATGAPSLQVKVSLAPELAAQAQPGDTLYVFARAVSGPPMPLAAAKLRAGDLPTEITLDDSMAMMPQMKLSSFPQVKVNARISRSGQPAAQSGDLESEARVVDVAPGVDVALVIDRVVP